MKPGVDFIGVSAGAFIFNAEGKVFLSKRGLKAKNERGCWESPGGKVEFGETLEGAMRRELLEEFGIEVDVIEQWPAENHLIPMEKQHWVATTFLCRIKPGQQPRNLELESGKCDAIGWFALDALPQPLSGITQLDLAQLSKRYPKGVGGVVGVRK